MTHPIIDPLEPRTLLAVTPLAPSRFAALSAGTTNNAATAVATDAAGNVYLAGRFAGTTAFDFPANVVTLTPSSTFASDGFVAKYAPTGQLQWARALDYTNPLLAVSPKGDVYLADAFGSPVDVDPSGNVVTLEPNPDRADVLLVHLDTDGRFVNANAVATADQDSAAIALTTDSLGRPHLLAESNVPTLGSTNLDVDTVLYRFNARLRNLYTIRWNTGPSVGGPVRAAALAVDPAGAAYVAGTTPAGVDFQPGRRVRTITGNARDNPFLLRVAPTGSFDWVIGQGVGSAQSPRFQALAADAAGNVFAAGPYTAGDDFNFSARRRRTLTPFSTLPGGNFVARYGPGAALRAAWDVNTDVNAATLAQVAVDPTSGNVFALGTLGNTSPIGVTDPRLTPQGTNDGFLATYSPAGTLQDAAGITPLGAKLPRPFFFSTAPAGRAYLADSITATTLDFFRGDTTQTTFLPGGTFILELS